MPRLCQVQVLSHQTSGFHFPAKIHEVVGSKGELTIDKMSQLYIHSNSDVLPSISQRFLSQLSGHFQLFLRHFCSIVRTENTVNFFS